MSREEGHEGKEDENIPSKRMKFEDTPEAENNCGEEGEPSTLSKRQRKRLEKKAAYEKWKVIKRAREKEKMKQKKLLAKLNNIPLGPSRKLLKNTTMALSTCKIHVVIDLSFDDYMNSKEISHCIKQILRCYSLNRRAQNPMQLHVTSFNGLTKEEMSKHSGYTNWDLFFHEESYLDVFKKQEITYLTSESDNVVTSLENDRAYIIGGLVDYNAHKGLCHRLAEENKVNHGQLPIGQYIEMKTRKVLTIDHVFEILIRVSEGDSWEEAFLKVLPSRKGARQKETSNCSRCMDDNSFPQEVSKQTVEAEDKTAADMLQGDESVKEITIHSENISVKDEITLLAVQAESDGCSKDSDNLLPAEETVPEEPIN